MLSLIKNEIYKLFHKKSTYIVLILTALFSILVSVIYKQDSYSNSYYYDEMLSEEELNYYRNCVTNHTNEYIYCQTKLDTNELKQKYADDSWQRTKINELYSGIVHDYYNSKEFGNNSEIEKKYNDFRNALAENNWKYFVNMDIKGAKEEINSLKGQINAQTDNVELKKQLFIEEETLKTLEYRLENDVAYGNDYLNDAINGIVFNASDVANYEYTTNANEKKNYEDSIKEFYENKYILETKEDTNNGQTLRAIFMNFFSEYFFLTLVFIVMIAGGIVSEEFNKGTIKSLLITPHKRSTILLAKFITILLMIPFFTLFALLVQFIVGAIFFGIKSLSVPVVVYNLTSKSLEVMGLAKYVLMLFVVSLPRIILLATLAFAVSTILNNTAFAIAITFCGFIGADLINAFASVYNVKILNYFVTTNWDFSVFLFGGTSPFGLSLTHSIITCLVYFAIMLVVSFIVFKKRDIKNI